MRGRGADRRRLSPLDLVSRLCAIGRALGQILLSEAVFTRAGCGGINLGSLG
jgi:hypothetical protein